MVTKLSRRRLLAIGSGGLTALAFGSGAVSAVAATPVVLYVLDPSWGFPVKQVNGSSTKTRCSSRACYKAAPFRFFLTEADAIAGRLHKGCLAQPRRIEVVIDLNALMPFYTARHGGVDTRGVELPTELRAALAASLSPSPAVLPLPEPGTPDPPPADPAPAPEAITLPVTGGSVAAVALTALAVTSVGLAATGAARRTDLVEHAA